MGHKNYMANPSLTETGGSSFVELETGSYPVRVQSIINLGTQQNDYDKNNITDQKQVLVTYEFVDESITIKGEELPRIMSVTYSNGCGELSKLRIAAEVLLDRKLPINVPFDLSELLGKPGIANVGLTSGGKPKVSGIIPPMRGMTVSPAKLPETMFDFDANFDLTVLEALPKWIVDKVKLSPEFHARTAGINF